jgi:predicted nucleotidyltransferase
VTAGPPDTREAAAELVLEVLAGAHPTGEVCLIGSLARPGEADELSDIDVRWTLPPGQASGPLQSLRSTLRQVGRVESLRLDPEERPGFLLLFVRFAGWPLWWRVDLEVHSTELSPADLPDADSWSPQESACMGVVVTLKALARNRTEEAEALFARALRRVGATDVVGDWPLRIDALLDRLVILGSPGADLVARTRRLSRDVLGR